MRNVRWIFALLLLSVFAVSTVGCNRESSGKGQKGKEHGGKEHAGTKTN